jgi:hypothetical protein
MIGICVAMLGSGTPQPLDHNNAMLNLVVVQISNILLHVY